MQDDSQVLYFNGTILTVDEEFSIPEAVLTAEDRVVAVGSFAALRKQASPNVRLRDLGGLTMIPGFIDPHGHFPDSGFLALFRVDLAPPPIGDCSSMTAVFDRLSDRLRSTPAGDWVIGARLDPDGLAEGRFPTRDELDRLSDRHPVWIGHFTGHGGVANSAALAFRGVDETTPNPPDGVFGRTPDGGRLNGLLTGPTAMGALGATEFMMNANGFARAMDVASQEYLNEGVTLAQNAYATGPLLEWFRELSEKRLDGVERRDWAVHVPVVVLPCGNLGRLPTDGEFGRSRGKVRGVRFGPRKFFADGSLHVQTACLSRPYHRPLNGDPGFRCEPAITVDGMVGRMMPHHQEGSQLHVHVNGDRAADILLDAFARILDRHPRQDHRHTLIHAQTLRSDQLDRIAELGLSVSFFSAHIHYWGEYHRQVSLGPERAETISPARSAANRRIRFTIHNDTTVTPMRPLHLMWCAASRRTTSGRVLGSNERISPKEALIAHTRDAAWQVFEERECGTIETGKRADLAILSANPLVDAESIREIRVVETVLGGTAISNSPT
ncbi:MAG: amidohydrolase [Paracoccaceae bacterium]|nr:amidohydrolase [Paracoccaceae bacterium]